jgi:hypothetical protein
MGDECVHLGRFHSYDVMVVFFIAKCTSKTHSKFKSTRELIRSLDLQGRGIDTIGQTYMVVSDVVIAKKGTLFEVVSGFSEKLFCLRPFSRGFVHAKL